MGHAPQVLALQATGANAELGRSASPSLIAFAAGMARRQAEFFIVCAPRGARTCAEVHRTMPARLSTSNLRCQTVSLLLPDKHDRQLLCLSALLFFRFSATLTAC